MTFGVCNQGAFFCIFREIRHDGAEAILDGAGSTRRKITAAKPLQDGGCKKNLDGARVQDGAEKLRTSIFCKKMHLD